MKEPDLSFFPAGPDGLLRDFPSIILESGWSSSRPELADERRLWHEGSGGRVRVVILVKLYRANVQNQVRAILEISRAASLGTIAAVTHQVPFLLPTLGLSTYHLLIC